VAANKRILEKQDRIEALAANVKKNCQDPQEVQANLQDIQDMVIN